MKELKTKLWSGGFLYNNKTKSVLLHQRDGNTKFNPNMWAFFGGLAEDDETPTECFKREIKEELNIDVDTDQIVAVCDYLNEEFDTYRYVYFVESEISKNQMILGEGAEFDWISLDKLDDHELTEKTVKDLKTFIDKYL